MPITPVLDTATVSAGLWSCDGRGVPANCIEPEWVLITPRRGSVIERVGRREPPLAPGLALVVGAGEFLLLRSPDRARVHATMVSVPATAGVSRARAGLAALTPRALLAHHRLLRDGLHRRDQLALEEAALELAASAHERSASPRLTVALRDAAQDAIALVATQPTPLSLGALAQQVGVAPWPLSRAIRALLGVPLREYLMRRRIATAFEQLAMSPCATISEVAHAAGFASHAHFTDAVRTRFGIAPRALLGRR